MGGSAMTAKATANAPTKTIDGYLATLSSDKRGALENLTRTSHTIIPRAEECISYQLPAFRIHGKVLIWFGAGANHCALYPGAIIERFRDELAQYQTSKGTIRFQPDHPLPVALVRKLVK